MRVASGRSGAGASSTTFWWRRCTEQSRSNRCTTVAVRVAEHLHLDVARPLDGLLEEDRPVAEGRRRLAGGRDGRVRELLGRPDEPQPAPAAARRRLDEQREPDRLGGLERALAVRQRVGGPEHRQARCHGGLPGRDLVAGQAEDVSGRADEGDAGRGAGLGERRALRQEAVAGVQRVRARAAGDLEQGVDVEVAADGMTGLAELVGLPRLGAVQRTRGPPACRRRR